MTPRTRLSASLVIVAVAVVFYAAFGPVAEETYFKTDMVSATEGELFISETPTDLSSVNIRWPLLLTLLAAFASTVWLFVSAFLDIKSLKNEVPQ